MSEVLLRPGQKFGSSFLLHAHRCSASVTTTSGTRAMASPKPGNSPKKWVSEVYLDRMGGDTSAVKKKHDWNPMADKSEWKTSSRKRREGRWTPIRAKAQDTRANPNSWETHLVRKRCGALDSYGHWAYGLWWWFREYSTNIATLLRISWAWCPTNICDKYIWQILHEHLTHTTINVYSRAYD